MQKVVLVQMVYNGMRYIPQSFAAMVNQTYPNIHIVAVINGNDDSGKEYIQQNFPQVKIIDPDENLLFVRGHNLVFSTIQADLFQLVNQDLILEPNYVEEMVKVFDDPKVGAANGKIFQYDFAANKKLNKLDTTGILISKSGGGRSRGQHQLDNGQFDSQLDLISVDGAACMYRNTTLQEVAYPRPDGTLEYFDDEFIMYWEDVDLGWRITNAGWQCKFVPTAVGYHGRTAAASPGGYARVFSYIKHHWAMPKYVRRFNYKNHILLYVKNSPKWYWQFFARELFYQTYVLFLETSTLKMVPQLLRQLPAIWKKRKFIQARRKISVQEMERLMQ